MYCYVVKWPVFRLQRGSAKSPIAPSNFSPACINQDMVLLATLQYVTTTSNILLHFKNDKMAKCTVKSK